VSFPASNPHNGAAQDVTAHTEQQKQKSDFLTRVSDEFTDQEPETKIKSELSAQYQPKQSFWQHQSEIKTTTSTHHISLF
jgi:hypothetical protein